MREVVLDQESMPGVCDGDSQDTVSDTVSSNAVENGTTSGPTSDEAPKTVWTLRKKLVLFTMCLNYFVALASVSIISPFFPNEVGNYLYCVALLRYFNFYTASLSCS